MTALIYKAALPTYTSLEDLNANAGESLLLNDAGTAYELEPAQGGAPVASIYCSFGTGAAQSGAGGDLIPSLAEMSPVHPGLTLHCGPLTVDIGWPVVINGVSLAPGVDASVNVELHVSNAAGTEQLLVYTDGDIALTEGVNRTLLIADWDTPTITGTDLSISAGGEIVSAAGGSFWATARFAVGS